MRLIPVIAAFVLSSTALVHAQGYEKPVQAEKPMQSEAQVIEKQLPSYPLDICPISKEKLGGSMGAPVDFVHEGHLVRFCCKSCVAEFKKDPAPVLKEIDAAVVAAQKPTYPIKTCPVSGEELGSTDAIDYVHGTRLVRFCCKDCLSQFKKEPAKVMAKVDQELISAQKKAYPLTACPISGKEIAGDAVDHLYGTRLVRFCCAKCPEAFRKDPAKTLSKLDAAKKGLKEAGAPVKKEG